MNLPTLLKSLQVAGIHCGLKHSLHETKNTGGAFTLSVDLIESAAIKSTAKTIVLLIILVKIIEIDIILLEKLSFYHYNFITDVKEIELSPSKDRTRKGQIWIS